MTFTISVADTNINFACEPGERILDAAERAGYVMPYSCRKGVCESCRCRLEQGFVAIAPLGTPKEAGVSILSCLASPVEDIEIRPEWIESRTLPNRAQVVATVHRIVPCSPNVTTLVLRLPIGVRVPFTAGQYVAIMLADGETRNYSIANPSRCNDEIELHIRRIPGGLFSDRVLTSLVVGDTLEIEMPFGLFGWSKSPKVPAILLATGTGFAPLKSMIADLIDRGDARPVHLFWGCEQAQDIYGTVIIERWSKSVPWFRFTPVLANGDAEWRGSRGFVQDAAAAHYGDLSGHEVYACGNPMMIDQAKSLLTSKCRLPDNAFFADAFVSASA